MSRNRTNKAVKLIIICACAAAVIAAALFAVNRVQKAKAIKAELEEAQALMQENETLLKKHLEDCGKRAEKREADFGMALKQREGADERIREQVRELSVVCLGDSIMLGAVPALYETFPNAYCDAAVSRSAWVVCGLLDDLKAKGKLGDVVVLNFGANGDCPDSEKEKIMERLSGKEVYWLTNTFAKTAFVNDKLAALAEKYDNLTVLDWKGYSAGHGEYFYTDGLHLKPEGRKAYAGFVFDSMCAPRIEAWNRETEEMIAAHEEEKRPQAAVYGNGLLAGCFGLIAEGGSSEAIADVPFTGGEGYSFESLKADLRDAAAGGTLARNIIIVFDVTGENGSHEGLDGARAGEILDICRESRVSFINVHDVRAALSEGEELFIKAGTYLTKEANSVLAEKINEALSGSR